MKKLFSIFLIIMLLPVAAFAQKLLVTKDGIVQATHNTRQYQRIKGKYSGHEFKVVPGMSPLKAGDAVPPNATVYHEVDTLTEIDNITDMADVKRILKKLARKLR